MNSYYLARTAIITFVLFFFQPVLAVEIEKGSIDQRDYEYFVLENQLQVLLISDPKADKAAAALDVNVGSYHDPQDRQGLAHFLEHMLFLGTKKYPEADEYQSFINRHGGSHNAYTDRHHTNYFFEVDARYLEEALDRFSQFFIHPLFDAVYVDRERNAVHSEFQANLREDFRRSYDVYRSVVNPEHPDAKFNVGSLTTLADRKNDLVRDDLLDFYKQHYSAEKMNLVLLGKESLGELRKFVKDRFALISYRDSNTKEQPHNNGENNEGKSIPLFLPEQLPFEVEIKSIKDIKQMSMSFPLPGAITYYHVKPLGYIGNILGHEGEGSLLSLLKRLGWAESLSAGGRDKGDGTGVFSVSIQLTEAGLQHRAQIRSLVFYVIEKIKREGIEGWRFEEQQLLANIAFQFRENGKAISMVSHLANNLHYYLPAEIISGDYLIKEFKPDLIKQYLTYLRPDNLYVTTLHPDVEADQISAYYKAGYSLNPLSKNLYPLEEKLTKAFSLPVKNPFIPENIELFPKDLALQTPSQLSAGDINLWAKQDISYGTPKAKIKYRITSPLVSGHLNGAALSALYVDLLNDALNEYSYPAYLAGATLSVSANNRGIDITLVGYHDKLSHLMGLLVEKMDKMEFDPERFRQLKTDLLRYWRNADKKSPYQQLYNQLAANLYELYWTEAEKLGALETLTLKDLQKFADSWRLGAQVTGLIYGNVDKTWLNQWQQFSESLRRDEEVSVTPVAIIQLDGDVASYDFDAIEHNDTAVALYVQGHRDGLSDRASMAVLRQIMQSPFYNSLRTEQQLGYIVFMGSLNLRQVPGSVFIVQSPSASVDDIRHAINNFITKFESQIPEDIGPYQKAVVTQLLEEPTRLSASADIYWASLVDGYEQFDKRERIAEAVKKLDREAIIKAFEQVMLKQGKRLWQFSRKPSLEKEEAQLFSPGGEKFIYP